MDNLGNSNDPVEKPIPFDDGLGKPTPRGNPPAGNPPSVSRAPLNLGGGGQPSAAKTPVPAPRTPIPVARKPVAPPAPITERITGIKTFFTKLHPGALEFMDEQIASWLKEHPEVCIKHTNVTTGEVQAKKTEPNIIVTVWY
ncbi:hypothetical protein [Anaerobaca lacustris]|uniref:Uncharacterized protein n=1 Tax=Anaerobaca lacustris TaxID=3044600 RepID=A0AAW6TYJ9_9BACT|nr:hypothetical protein [Sedimentisphaerales bacterium M17dextr]